MKKIMLLLAVVAALNLFAEGEPKMPTLNCMGREKATKSVKEVVMKILREDKSLGKCCQCEKVASTSSSNQLETGNIGIGNTSTLATLDKCFGFTKMDAGEIDRIKKAAFVR